MDLRSAKRPIARRARRFAAALVGVCALAPPVFAACGRPVGPVEAVAVDERLDVALEDGRLVRLGGLDPTAARGTPALQGAASALLARLVVGRPVQFLLLMNAPDRQGGPGTIFKIRVDLCCEQSGSAGTRLP